MELLTLDEAARRLVECGILTRVPNIYTLYSWSKQQLWPAIKVPSRGQGGSWRVPADALDAFVPPALGRPREEKANE
jgi:hypothetical protein